jgi:type III pantothenate kinase
LNLVIDIGNTAIKTALITDYKVVEFARHKTIDEAIAWVKDRQFKKAIIGTVVDNYSALAEFIRTKTDCLLFEQATPIPLKNLYKSSATLGSDRMAAAMGCDFLFPNKTCLSIDIGTCIKYNLQLSDGSYLGGAISPGLRLRYKSMNDYTDRLPLIQQSEEAIDLIGQTTEKSLQSGVQLGAALEIDGYINAVKENYNNLIVIVTGGDAPYLVKHLKNSIFAEPNLVLTGLNHILEFNT